MKKVLRNFELVDRIDSGGMGTVYRAVQLSLKRTVAVKELHPQLSSQKEYTERFEREALVLGAMFNENIVGIVDFGMEDGSYYIIMEYIDGVSLADILDKISNLSENVALTIIEHITRGLAYAHSKGVVHRDIKPANILISADEVVKVTDFGLCRPLKESNITQNKTLMGTPRYMSPEQARGFSVDERSDIYSLGILFFEILTGFYAIWSENTVEILQDVAFGERLDISRLPSATNPIIKNIIERTTEKDPNRRFDSCKDILSQIRKLRISNRTFNNPANLDELLNAMNFKRKTEIFPFPKLTSKNSTTKASLPKVPPQTQAIEETGDLFLFSGNLSNVNPAQYIVRYHPFYMETEASAELEVAVQNLQNVLIVGRPASGKTRTAYEIVQKIAKNRHDWQIFIPSAKELDDIDLLLNQITKSKCLILWEDIDQYISFWDPKSIFGALEGSLDQLQIIGTLRTGNEFNSVETIRTDWFYFFDKRIILKDLSDEQALELANNIPNISTANFDGTPGSIVLDLGKIKTRYRNIRNPFRAILKAMKMFSLVGIKNIERPILLEAANVLFGSSLDKFTFREIMHNLIDNNLVARNDDMYTFYHPSYAEKIVTDYETPELTEDMSDFIEIIKNHRNPYYMVSLSNVLSSLDDSVNTIALTTLALEIKPDFAKAYSIRGMAKCNLEDYENSILDYDKAIEYKPLNADFYNNRGVAKSYSEDIKGAISDYNMAISLKTNHSETYFNRATVYYNTGDYKNALDDYNRTIELSPEYAPAYNNRAILRSYELNDIEGALQDYQKAIELMPEYTNSYYNRANILSYNNEEYIEAIKDYDKAISLKNDFAEAWYNRGIALLNIMEPQNALDSFKTAIEHSDWAKETLAYDEDFHNFLQKHPGVYGLFSIQIQQLLKPFTLFQKADKKNKAA